MDPGRRPPLRGIVVGCFFALVFGALVYNISFHASRDAKPRFRAEAPVRNSTERPVTKDKPRPVLAIMPAAPQAGGGPPTTATATVSSGPEIASVVVAPETSLVAKHPEVVLAGEKDPAKESAHEERLLSVNASVTSSARGNLGPPEVLVDGKPSSQKDWIKERWQVAKDMNGSPMPLPQWVRVDLGKSRTVTKVDLDWETAFAAGYEIQVSEDDEGWSPVHVEKNGSGRATSDKHIVHTFTLATPEEARYVRVFITRNGTGWGSSLWALSVYGY